MFCTLISCLVFSSACGPSYSYNVDDEVETEYEEDEPRQTPASKAGTVRSRSRGNVLNVPTRASQSESFSVRQARRSAKIAQCKFDETYSKDRLGEGNSHHTLRERNPVLHAHQFFLKTKGQHRSILCKLKESCRKREDAKPDGNHELCTQYDQCCDITVRTNRSPVSHSKLDRIVVEEEVPEPEDWD